jgi:cell division protein ZapB
MSSEFQQLSDKVAQLAAMTHSLRRENAELRRHASALTDENTELMRRIDAAHQRVAAVLEKLPTAPVPTIDEEENV